MVDQTATILKLPVELRDNVIACLNIKDVLSLSSTCRYLRAIKESRKTWMTFVQKLQLQPHISKIEKPLEDFTTRELIDWVLRRYKIRRCLRSGSHVMCRHIRVIDTAQGSTLLPGGRWLLFVTSPGNIFYADCDAPHPEAQPLITFEAVVPNYFRSQFVVWRDPDSARLTFRVAFVYWCHRGLDARDYQAHFCKIDLVGHGSSANLVAERIHQYQGGMSFGPTSDEGIRGEYFYQVHYIQGYLEPTDYQAILEILDYGHGSSVAKKVNLVDFSRFFNGWRLNLLPDGRIVVSGLAEVIIYPDPLPIVGDEMKTLAPLLVLENVCLFSEVDVGSVSMSGWYCGLDSNMAVYGTSGERVTVVWIPHDGAPPMRRTIEALMPNSISRYILGLFHGVSMVSRGRISILSYPWGDSQSEVDPRGMTRRIFKVEQDENNHATYDIGQGSIGGVEMLYFNEEIGRTIIRDQRRRYFALDIVAV